MDTPTCNKRKSFGHADKQCPTKQAWMPKSKSVTAEDTCMKNQIGGKDRKRREDAETSQLG